jgi:hypothetical protein
MSQRADKRITRKPAMIEDFLKFTYGLPAARAAT